MTAFRARAWRTTFVAPSRTDHANASSTSSSRYSRLVVDIGLHARRFERRQCAVELALQPESAVATDRRTDVHQRPSRNPFDVGHLGGSPGRIPGQSTAGQLGFQRDHRQAVAKQVVEVASNSEPLVRRGEAGDLRSCLLQLAVDDHETRQRQGAEPDERESERSLDPVRGVRENEPSRPRP